MNVHVVDSVTSCTSNPSPGSSEESSTAAANARSAAVVASPHHPDPAADATTSAERDPVVAAEGRTIDTERGSAPVVFKILAILSVES